MGQRVSERETKMSKSKISTKSIRYKVRTVSKFGFQTRLHPPKLLVTFSFCFSFGALVPFFFFVRRRRRLAVPVFQARLKGSGSTVMNLETRGSTAQTTTLALETSGSTAQCQRAEQSPGKAADSWTLAMPDTTLCSAVENHTMGESSTRDPMVLEPRRWFAHGVTVCHTLREGTRCAVCSRVVTHSDSFAVKTVTTSRHTQRLLRTAPRALRSDTPEAQRSVARYV